MLPLVWAGLTTEEHPICLVRDLGKVHFGDGVRRETAKAGNSRPIDRSSRPDQAERELVAGITGGSSFNHARPLGIEADHPRNGAAVAERVSDVAVVLDREVGQSV